MFQVSVIVQIIILEVMFQFYKFENINYIPMLLWRFILDMLVMKSFKIIVIFRAVFSYFCFVFCLS